MSNLIIRSLTVPVSAPPPSTEARRTEVLRELQAVQSREMRLLSSQQTLERELEVAVGERAKVKEALEENKLQLTKTKIASQTMEKKNKVSYSRMRR